MFRNIIEYYKSAFIGQTASYIICQVFGIFILIFNFFIYVQKTRGRILAFKATSDIAWAIQNFLLHAYTGALITGIAVVSEFVFYFRDRKKWADSIAWLFVFLSLMLISPILTWSGYISLFPAIGSCFAVIGLYNKNTVITKILVFIGSGLWLIYQIITLNVGGAIGSVISIVSIIVGLIREVSFNKTKKTLSDKKAD